MLSIRKTSVPKTLRKQFTKILQEDVLEKEVIDLKTIINKYDQMEAQISDSLKAGKTEYVLPKNLEVIESYKTPDTIESVRAAIIWNALEPENQIVPPEKINIIKLNCIDKADPRLQKLKETHPDKYNTIMKVVFNEGVSTPKLDISRFGFNCVALPKSLDSIPEYLLPFVDYTDMINTNMTNGYIILESLGIYCEEVNNVKYKSNIIAL